MFTGIVRDLCRVAKIQKKPQLMSYAIQFDNSWLRRLEVGASVSVDGVCQTVTKLEQNLVWFDAIQETLNRTTLDSLEIGRQVNIEPSARIGDEIGGHLLSGHIFGKAQISHINQSENQYIVKIQCSPDWMKYFFSKGFIALDGASLTLVDVDPKGEFTVHLIPETLARTTFGFKKVGDFLNVELDSQTQIIVETIERLIAQQPHLYQDTCKSSR